jgi:hypothetical protein
MGQVTAQTISFGAAELAEQMPEGRLGWLKGL